MELSAQQWIFSHGKCFFSIPTLPFPSAASLLNLGNGKLHRKIPQVEISNAGTGEHVSLPAVEISGHQRNITNFFRSAKIEIQNSIRKSSAIFF